MFKSYLILRGLPFETAADPTDRAYVKRYHSGSLIWASRCRVHPILMCIFYVFPFLFFAVLETDIRAALCFTHVAVSSNLVSFLLYLFLSSYEGSPLICIYLHPELFNFSAGVGSLYVFSPGGIVTLLMYVLRSFFAMFRR